jgi:hypothetical protein
MKKLYRIFGFIFFVTFLCAFHKNCFAQNYGLSFYSHEVFQDKRTSLDLNPGQTFHFENNFDISFDLSFCPNHDTYFGYIIRIIEDDTRNFDLMYSPQDPNNHFNFVVGDKLSKIKFEIPLDKLFHQWNRLNVKFDFEKDQVVFYVNNRAIVENGLHLKTNGHYKILFGTNNYKQFATTDTPPIKLRDIKIKQNNVINYDWPLNETSGNVVHEIIAQQNGTVINPLWISAMHHDWEKSMSVTVDGIASAAFDTKKEMLYIVARDSVYSYSVGHSAMLSNFNAVKPNLNQGNQSVYNRFDNGLYNFFPGQKTVAKYSFEKHTWDKKFVGDQITTYWHANKAISGTDTSMYLFGGYGLLLYKNSVQRYSFNNQKWQDIKYKGDFFMPRYLAASGSNDNGDTIYILGGYGSSTGQQILDPKNTYDMMRFTVKDKTFKKLFNLKVNDQDFAFANSLIVDAKEKKYYGLIFPQNKYNSSLRLISGSLENPFYHVLGSAIPYDFNDIHSFADLYYCPLSKKFLVVTLLRTDNNQTKVAIYTLLYPPLNISINSASAKSNGVLYIALFVLILLTIAGLVRYKLRRNKIQRIEEKVPHDLANLNISDKYVSANGFSNDILNGLNGSDADEIPRKNAILLFGDLQVFDNDGVDITKFFTPLVKELFLLILLYSIKKGRGLTSEKLNEILWFDKSAKSARNNRSVNIAKLKSLLDKHRF